MESALDVDGSRSPFMVVALQGDLDLYSTPRLRARLVELLDQGHRQILLDLNRADFVDSAGLAVIVAGLKRLRSLDGDLSLVCEGRNLFKLLEISGLTSVFRIAPTIDAATVR